MSCREETYGHVSRLRSRHRALLGSGPIDETAVYATLPAGVLRTLATLGWKLRILPFPASILDFIRYPWVTVMKQFP